MHHRVCKRPVAKLLRKDCLTRQGMTWNWNWAALQADSTLSRLNVLRKKIDDTEALISIHLDSRRNDLVAFDLVRSPPIEAPSSWELC